MLPFPRPLGAPMSGIAKRRRRRNEIGSIEIILAGDTNEGEQGVAAGIGEGRAHAMRGCGLTDGTDWPIGCNPFSGRMGQHGRQIDDPRGIVDGRRLDRGDLMLA